MNQLQRAKKYAFAKSRFKKKASSIWMALFYVRKAVLFPNDLTRFAHYIARETNLTLYLNDED